MTTTELLNKCVNKDRIAWDEFTRRYRRTVAKSVKYKLTSLGLAHSRNEVSDIIQEVFLLIWEKEKLTGIKDSSCLENWLVIVSINATSSYCRKNVFKTKDLMDSLHKEVSNETPELTLESILPARNLDTAKTLESRELGHILKTEISKLGHTEQLALKFNIYDNKKHKDIARIMNLPAGTVSTLISRAKIKLRNTLKRRIYYE